MLNDPIADFLTRIRNASMANKEVVEVGASRVKANIARVLKEEGYIKNFRLVRIGNNKFIIRMYLRYGVKGEQIIKKITRLSRPGLRRYVNVNEIPRVLNGAGTVILTTPRGVMTGRQAKKEKVGGELLCSVY